MATFAEVYEKAAPILEDHEGRENKPYRDTVGKLTIGIGFNLDDVGLSDDEIDAILKLRLGKLYSILSTRLSYFATLSIPRQIVLLDMAYNLGVDGLLKFKQTLASVAAGRYSVAAQQMLASKWATQVGRRAIRLSQMMKTGELQ